MSYATKKWACNNKKLMPRPKTFQSQPGLKSMCKKSKGLETYRTYTLNI